MSETLSRARRVREPPGDPTLAHLYDKYIAGDAEAEEAYERYGLEFDIAQQIYDARSAAGLTQAQLAQMIGTTASAICRLESADYEGHSMLMLRRIAVALGKRVEVRFVDAADAAGPQSNEGSAFPQLSANPP